MGSDLSVVNAARVSFDKVNNTSSITEGDKRLIAFLARENHWTPFGHASLSFHIKAPIFVARQLFKHTIGGVINEVSRRYVDTAPEFYYPENWRKRNKDKKQGSHEDQFVEEISFTHPYMGDIKGNKVSITESVTKFTKTLNAQALNTYHIMLEAGICPEQARMILPQNMYTELYWTCSLAFFARVCKLRSTKDVQHETRLVADQIKKIVLEKFPISAQCLLDINDDN